MPIISVEKLNNANLDAETIEQVVNGEPNVLVESREGRKIPTLATLGEKHFSAGVILYGEKTQEQVNDEVGNALTGLSFANKTYATVAAANEDIANIAVNQSVWVSSATEGGLYEKKTADATSLTKSAFDPVVQAKGYANANPLFKQKQIVAGDDFNNFKIPGRYYIWSNLTSAQVLNAPYYSGGNVIRGVLEVENSQPDGSGASSCHQTFYPASDGLPIATRKCAQNGVWPSTWDSIVRASELKNLTRLPVNTDILSLNFGEYQVYSEVDGLTMLNMPPSTRKAGRISVSRTAGTAPRSIVFMPFGDDPNFYINKESTAGVWVGWKTFKDYASLLSEFALKTDVSSAISSFTDTLLQSDYFGKNYTDAEILGTKFYGSAPYAGFNQVTTNASTFNKMKARIWNASGDSIQYRVYMGSKVTVGATGNTVSAANIQNPDFLGVCKSFPKSDTNEIQDIVFDKAISIPANTPFVIIFRANNFALFTIACHGIVSGNLDNRSFSLSTSTSDWSALTAISVANVPTYTQSGFKLVLELATSGSAESAYTPPIVLPPKIYALPGLQTHIYPEHILPEDSSLYEHDVVCAVGKQVNRGFWWDVPAGQAAGTHALTWKVFDKARGKELASASSSIVIGNSAKSGNINVCVIGDSYISAGVITQGLLDLSATDPLKVNLIGTRGAGLNKHEGCGGWRIEDYATAGRTYYQFTVSGVTTAPAINSATYTVGSAEFLVQETNLSGGSGTITCSLNSGTPPANGATGTLVKKNTSAGDANIAFSDVQSQSGNPFWIGGAINFPQYLANNSLALPDYVLIQLGVNDSFQMTSDAAVETLTTTAFAQLDSLIASIKAANTNVKIGLMMAPTYASQDAFGANYASNYTSWRAKRNIVTWNRKLVDYYKTKENTGVYLVGSGFNVDTIENFPFTDIASPVNSRNPKTVFTQNNGVHPSNYGYLQIRDVAFSFVKAV
ncbi:hypothetical protein KMZ14_06560 [Acinetobacter schindleri]|uniref:SGNH/GDSL hydrolase family protein n=1 Tax=Acinetobacter schindleri TaxID=108981 RepID=UPI002361D951|nr:SGNH/GDSL hydrolase family protein [Acinetobacter schindleri]WDE17187.1 hypothetical protein KMZ14_06560 [Acinetobacter schindleri]